MNINILKKFKLIFYIYINYIYKITLTLYFCLFYFILFYFIFIFFLRATLHNGLYSIPDYESGIAALPILTLTTDRSCPLYARGTHLLEQEVIQIQEFPGEDPWTP